jgi:uracil-DNA glycosylase
VTGQQPRRSWLVEDIPEDWRDALTDAVDAPSFRQLDGFLAKERARTDTVIYPRESEVYTALRLTPLASVRAVILGQDPYSQEGLATGLAFSIPDECKQPRSLQNIMKARELDLGLPVPSSGSLEQWARSGVLLMNTALTVRRGEANSHRKCWKVFTKAVIGAVGAQTRPIVFLLWGRQARQMRTLTPSRHTYVESVHPAARGTEPRFIDSKPFSRADTALHDLHIWSLPGDP